MSVRKLLLGMIFIGFVLVSRSVLALTVDTPNKVVSINFNDLDGTTITVKTHGQYLPFFIKVRNVPKGEYSISIPEEYRENIICAPTAFKFSGTSDMEITCIVKPTTVNNINMVVTRTYNNSTQSYDVYINIVNQKIWYKVFSGGVPSGSSISNGEYTIIPKAKSIFSLMVVRKGGTVVFTGLMFPGQELNVTNDLKIKFFGAYDNVSYFEVYSTSDNKFAEVSLESKIKYVFVKPVCKVEGDFIVLKDVDANVYYTDGSNETISANATPVKIPKKNVAKVICGKILQFSTVPVKPTKPQPKPTTTNAPTFRIPPRTIYYVGDTVNIVANRPFTISCDNGLQENTTVFTHKFEAPATCTVVLGSQIRTFYVKNRPAATTASANQFYNKYNIQDYYRLLGLLLIIAAGYYIYKNRERFKFIRKKEEKEEPEEVVVKNALEGEH